MADWISLVSQLALVVVSVAVGRMSPTYLRFLRWLPLIGLILPVAQIAITGVPDRPSSLLPYLALSLGVGLAWGTSAFLIVRIGRWLLSKDIDLHRVGRNPLTLLNILRRSRDNAGRVRD